MWNLLRKFTPLFLVLMTLAFVEGGITTSYSEARSMKGGRSFSSSKRTTTSTMQSNKATSATQNNQKGSFAKGLMGGLLGGALGAMLFGSMFGGEGIGILPILILAGLAFFLYRKFAAQKGATNRQHYQANNQFGSNNNQFGSTQQDHFNQQQQAPLAPNFASDLGSKFGGEPSVEDGLAQIRATDPDFEKEYFTEIASDVFFQVQAGWMRRDIASYKHLLGAQLANEYAAKFEDMKAAGRTNKLESIAVRSIEIVDAGSDGREDFVTVQFVASLLDYTVDDKTGDVVEGSNTTPVKFDEQWTWARPVRTNDWKLEGIS